MLWSNTRFEKYAPNGLIYASPSPRLEVLLHLLSHTQKNGIGDSDL